MTQRSSASGRSSKEKLQSSDCLGRRQRVGEDFQDDDTQAKSTKEVRRIQGLQKTTNQTPTGCMTSIKVKIAREWNVHAGHQWNVHAGTGADERMESGIDEMNRLRRTKLNANVLKKKLQRWVCRKPRCWAPKLSYSWYCTTNVQPSSYNQSCTRSWGSRCQLMSSEPNSDCLCKQYRSTFSWNLEIPILVLQIVSFFPLFSPSLHSLPAHNNYASTDIPRTC